MFRALVPKILTQYRRGGPRSLYSKLFVADLTDLLFEI